MAPDARVCEPTMPPLGGAPVIALEDAGALHRESLARAISVFVLTARVPDDSY